MSEHYPCVVQASLQSKRLPGKVLMEVYRGKTMLEMVVEAALRSERVSKVIVQMPAQEEDDLLSRKVDQLRYQWTVTPQKPIEIVRFGKKDTPCDFEFMSGQGDFFRVTADCPLLDHRLFDVLSLETTLGVASYTHRDGDDRSLYPDGWDVELIRGEALEKAGWNLEEMYRGACTVQAQYPYPQKPLPGLSASVNWYHDLVWVRWVCEAVLDPTQYEQVVVWYNKMRQQEG